MTSDEKIVRDAWQVVHGAYKEMQFFVWLRGGDYIPKAKFVRDTEAEAWSAAARFTEERKEEIRQIERQRGFIQRQIDCYRSPEEMRQSYSVDDIVNATRNLLTWSLILDRLQSALADLKRGMKP